jgi:hypothetical protein
VQCEKSIFRSFWAHVLFRRVCGELTIWQSPKIAKRCVECIFVVTASLISFLCSIYLFC